MNPNSTIVKLLANNLIVNQSPLALIAAVGQLVIDLVALLDAKVSEVIVPLASDTPGKIQVPLEHGDSICMDGANEGILE